MADTEQIEMQAKPTEAQPAPQPQKKSSAGKILLIGCIVLLLLSALCCAVFGGITYFAANAGLKAMKGEAANVICSNDSKTKAEDIYLNNTTSEFRSRVTQTEFTSMLSSISKDGCDELKNAGFMEVIKKGWSIKTETMNGVNTYNFEGKLGDKEVKVRMVSEDGELKIDDLQVK